jgi:hypothetical protein
MNDLLNHLLDQQHVLPNQLILDCLTVARLNPDPTVRIPAAELGQHFGQVNTRTVSTRMRRLKRRGLVDYDIGIPYQPGYRITRVGPPA